MRTKDLIDKHFACIYCLVFPNGKRYIGKTHDIGRRISLYERYCNTNNDLYNAIKEYGFDNIEIEIKSEVACRNKIDLEVCLSILEILSHMAESLLKVLFWC